MNSVVRRFAFALSLAGVLLVSAGAVSRSAQTESTPGAVESAFAWLQLGPDGEQIARATSSGECPEIVVDGVASAMNVRAEPSAEFPVTVCESLVPPDAESVEIGETALPVPSTDPQRILIVGDTGCTIVPENQAQACNDPAAWTFPRVAEQGAAWQPDLIIHTGDYVSREVACPSGDAGCEGSPYGDTWASWQADVFAPASPLLAEAPWIFVRGNHEECGRTGDGWFRLLDPRPMPDACQDYTDPYAVPIGDQLGIVLDAASAEDIETEEESTAAFRHHFADVERLAGDGPAWLLSHKSFWSLGVGGDGEAVEWMTATFTDAGYLQPPAAIGLILAGHVKMAQHLQFTEDSGRPVVVISGNGGTFPDMFEAGTFTGADLGDEALIEGSRYEGHGFTGLEKVEGGWMMSFQLLDGSVPASCLISGRTLDCGI